MEESRNMRTGNSKNTRPMKIVEPATTIVDEGTFLRIFTELPDIAEEKIKIDLENHSTSVTVAVSDTVKPYKGVITIPGEVKFSKKRFSNGILELTLEKITPKKS
jgi:HSP20 family molecular chaperone IbpA